MKLYVRDLAFTAAGDPAVNDGPQGDVGTWGAVDQAKVTIAPGKSVVIGLTVAAPAGAEPGDHVGVLVAESDPQGTDVKVMKRVATRLYVTIPGDAERELAVDEIESSTPSPLFGRTAVVSVSVRNTAGPASSPRCASAAAGRAVPGSWSRRRSSVTRPRSTCRGTGAPVKIPVEVASDGAPTHSREVSLFVVPWGPIAALLLLLLALGLARWLLTRTGRGVGHRRATAAGFEPFWPGP